VSPEIASFREGPPRTTLRIFLVDDTASILKVMWQVLLSYSSRPLTCYSFPLSLSFAWL
jgi:CheY-like chemotaxis protein